MSAPNSVSRRAVRLSAGVAVLAGALFAQQTGETTRQLYYLSTGEKESLPPVPQKTPVPEAPKAPISEAPQVSTTEAPKPAVVHLGLRYNLVLVPATGKAEPVSSDRVFRPGDCLAVDIQANRSGYIYVLAKQSSGSWTPLLPSPEMPGETMTLDPGKKIRVPKNYCFEVHNPPGTETLFVVLSRDPKDFYELYESIKAKPEQARASKRTEQAETASPAAVSSAVEHMNEKFATRDLSVRKIEEPIRSDETRGSVYVVNTSDKPSSSLVTQILIRHR